MRRWRKTTLIVFCCMAVAAALGTGWVVFGGVPWRIDTRFATEASLRYHWDERTMDVVIADASDVRRLKDTLAGLAYASPVDDHTSRMFSADASITLTDGARRITFCPNFCALAGDDTLVEIGETGKYLHLSDRRSKTLDAIFRKYGVPFPP